GTITARIAQPLSSQWSKPGVMMRASLQANSAHVATLLVPPKWKAAVVCRKDVGEETSENGTREIKEPLVINGNRLMEPYWVRLTRQGNAFSGYVSEDGKSWQKLVTLTVELPNELYAGLTACSQLEKVTTRLTYDSVTVDRITERSDSDPATQ
ncbi:MAG: hypothetical protein AAF497_21675, partial [Planctomycetota bacterium]